MVNEEEAAVVSSVTSLRRTGASCSEIAAALSDDGMTTVVGEGGTPTKCAGSQLRVGVS